MKRRLRDEIQQSKPFEVLEEEVYVEILRTSQVAARWIVEALRPMDLSAPQFNVLRILRGAGPSGLPSGRIAERMVNHDPDLTRLLDRLDSRGLVEKSRDTKDRRVVNACITATGLEAVTAATRSVHTRLRAALHGVSATKLGQLADLLELVRASGSSAYPASPNVIHPTIRGGNDGTSGSRTRKARRQARRP
jgi:DNA-binding MarR family transcriptional regulator